MHVRTAHHITGGPKNGVRNSMTLSEKIDSVSMKREKIERLVCEEKRGYERHMPHLFGVSHTFSVRNLTVSMLNH